MDIKGIIFDLDGTLVDTEPIHRDAWYAVLAEYDLHFEPEWFDQWIGKADRVLAEGVIPRYGIQAVADTLQEKKRRTYHRMAARSAGMFPGVEDRLPALKDRYPLAIATNSSDDDAAAVFKKTRLDRHFLTVVTSDQVNRLKPAPDMYLLAARRLKLATEACLVVEDSPAGIMAAKEAGMQVLAVTNSHLEKSLLLADQVFASTEAALDWIIGNNF